MRRPTRAQLDAAIDSLRFRIDTFPALDYQPLPWLGVEKARRDAGSRSRLDAIVGRLDSIGGVRTALDVGANVGWFSINLVQRGIQVVAVEQDAKYYRPMLHARARLRLDDLSVMVLGVDDRTVQMLPSADATLFLSVWHHVVRHRGLEAASAVLRALWDRTSRVLFFETGAAELPSEWGLPKLEPTPREWLVAYLERTCSQGKVGFLGMHPALSPSGDAVQRELFAVERTTP